MSLCFITLSFRDSNERYTHRVVKRFCKNYLKEIRMLCKEFGDKQRHLHFHSIVELPHGIAKNRSRLSEELRCTDQAYGLKIVRDLTTKQELYYVGYMQKEIKNALPVDIIKDRIFHNLYGPGYMKKAWDLYSSSPAKHKNWAAKLSYDGTELAFTLCSTYTFKGYDQALYCVFDYARANKIDVKRPESIAHMMLHILRMEKLKNIPVKKV